jgi:hypothetical protein
MRGGGGRTWREREEGHRDVEGIKEECREIEGREVRRSEAWAGR